MLGKRSKKVRRFGTMLVAAAICVSLLGFQPTSTALAAARHVQVPRSGQLVRSSAARTKHLLGIDIWWIKRGSEGLSQRDEQLARYVAHVLHGNAVAISFPIFTRSETSNSVWASPRFTPSPGELAGLIAACRKYHLTVTLRPLLNIGTKQYDWRGQIRPTNLHKFFGSYAGALKRYLLLAEAEHMTTFVYASEFWHQSTQPSAIPAWKYLLKKLRRWYRGSLQYDASGNQFALRSLIVPGYGNYTDAYFGVHTHWTAPEKKLYKSWLERFHRVPRRLLRRTVLQEVGIAAVYLGYWRPSTVTSHHAKRKFLVMQQRWFSMVCHIVHHFHMKGVYFWTLYYGVNPYKVKKDNLWYDPSQWVNRSGGREIASCFSRF